MKESTIELVIRSRIVAIIRGFDPETCLHLAEAYAKGGIRLVEVTFNQKAPESWKDTAAAISAMRKRFGDELAIGAGTVITPEQLSICASAGGEFMVAPNVDAALIRECARLGLVSMPGALTPTEAVEAWKAGADFVKLFPVTALGSAYVKAICAPLSHIRFLAVGGVRPDNIAEFLKAGCVGAGVGGNLVNKEWVAAGEWRKIEEAARGFFAACGLEN